MQRIYIIVNPAAGRGHGELAAPQIAEHFKALDVTFEMVLTTHPGEASELAEAAAISGWEVVAAAGGDGTLNEVLNGLARAHTRGPVQAALGVIPVGRGNDFAFGAGAAMDIPTACAALAAGQCKWIDVGFVRGGDYPQGRYFGNGVGIGFDAVVGFVAARQKRLQGFASYIVAALKTIFLYYQAPTVDVAFDGEQLTQPALMISVMNGRRMGGGFLMAPQGQVDDGLLDVCLAGQVSKPAIFGLIPRFMQGTQAGHPAIRMVRTNRLRVTARHGTLPAHADGETLCTAGQQLELSLLPRLLQVVVPVVPEEKPELTREDGVPSPSKEPDNREGANL